MKFNSSKKAFILIGIILTILLIYDLTLIPEIVMKSEVNGSISKGSYYGAIYKLNYYYLGISILLILGIIISFRKATKIKA